MTEFDLIVGQLRGAIATIGLSHKVDDDGLRDVLSFLVKVSQVVDQAFQDVLTLIIEIAYIDFTPQSVLRIDKLREELELLTARSHYRENLEICSRLRHLKLHFEEHIRPALGELDDVEQWQQVFWLIEDREGRLISLIESTVCRLRDDLESARRDSGRSARAMARELINEIRPLLADLRNLTNQILGLSGRRGFLELTRDRSALRQAINLIIQQGSTHVSGDTYVTRNAGAVGPNAQAINTTITENYGAILKGTDLPRLSIELGELCKALGVEASDTAHFKTLTAVSEARDAARKGEASGVATKLKEAGQWAIDVATKIGTTLAEEALKKSMGIS